MDISLQQNIKASLDQHLEMSLSPKIIHMLKILNLSYAELLDHIEKEAEENVMLEIDRPDRLLEYLRFLGDDKKLRKQVDFDEYPGLENVKYSEKNLHNALFEQLEIENPEEPYYSICKDLIENIDERGYLPNYYELRPRLEEKFNTSRPSVDKALKIIQSFEPDGVGARDLKECLEIQINEYNFENEELQELLLTVVANHLKDLSEEKFSKIAEKLNIKESGVKHISAFIKENLTPYPGSAFGSAARPVIPSFAIEEDEGKYQLINLEKEYGPKLSLNAPYQKMLEDKNADDETKKYLKEKLAKAQELIDNINRRQHTFEKIMAHITQKQIPFLKNGSSWLRGLLQKSIAAELSLHPSTISRAIADKYVQTPQGQIPIKKMCPRENNGISVPRIQSIINDIVNAEDKNNPLSDEEIKTILKLEGVTIERRTVAAYRKKLNIPSSSERASE